MLGQPGPKSMGGFQRNRTTFLRIRMTPILASIFKVQKNGHGCLLTVAVDNKGHSGSFESLTFGSPPDLGWCQQGWLELVYTEAPGFRAGDLFPLWQTEVELLGKRSSGRNR
jgi:hypothetical protein